MTSIWFVFLLVNLVHGFNSNCKYFVNRLNSKLELGLCKKNIDKYNGRKICNLTIYCSNNEYLHDKSGAIYENNENNENTYCAKFSETEYLKELEEIEKDTLHIFQRIRKHNTKRIYRTAKDLYKLFKK